MDKTTQKLLIFGGIFAALSIGVYFFVKKSKEHNTVSNNNILPSNIPSNQWTVGYSIVKLNESINGDIVTVTYSVSGGNDDSTTLTTFTPPVKSPRAIYADRYTNGVKTGTIHIDGSFAYVQGSGDGSLSWSYKM